MNKFTLLLALSLISLSVFSQNTYVPDDNFEQALIDLGYDDVLDDYVLTSNISGITSLDVSCKGISDFTGIEDFIALEALFCVNNQLVNLNISTNVALQILRCTSNQLTNLDVSENTALQQLDCDENQLTNLNVSENTALQQLDCDENQLTNLNVSENTALSFLFCSNNQLTSLDVSANSALTRLYCWNNQLTNLNVSENTALYSLLCIDNQLTSLDVRNGNNANIQSFDATYNPDLLCIYVDDKEASYLTYWEIDPASTFVETEAECDALSIHDLSESQQILIYPNPIQNQFKINIEKEILSVNIFDLLGRKIKAFAPQKSYLIDGINKGIYFIEIETQEKQILNKVIID